MILFSVLLYLLQIFFTLDFEIILCLKKSGKDSTEDSHIPFNQLLLMLASYIPWCRLYSDFPIMSQSPLICDSFSVFLLFYYID